MNRLLLCLSLLCLNYTLTARMVVFSGEVLNPIEKYITLSLVENELTKERRIFRATLNKDHTFSIGIDIGDHQWIYLQNEDEELEIFVADKDKEINFRYNAYDLSAAEFTGRNADNNRFLNRFKRQHHWLNNEMTQYKRGGLITEINQEIKRKAQVYAAQDYFNVIKSEFEFQKKDLFSQTTLDRDIFLYFNQAIAWKYETHKLAYFLYNRDRLKPVTIREYWTRYALLQETILNEDESVQYPVFQNLLSAFIHYLELESPGDPKKRDFAYYRFIDGNLSGKARFFSQAALMLNAYRQGGNPQLAQRKFGHYKSSNPYPQYTISLEEAFGGNMEYVPKRNVPDFVAIDRHGNKVRLSDYNGKVVYLSFWASWCGPCLRGFRDTEQTRRQLEQKGVVFLNVNLDDTEQIWHNTLQKKDIPGIHLFPEEMTVFSREFKVSSLPFYLLVNKQGQLTYLSSDDLNLAMAEFGVLLGE